MKVVRNIKIKQLFRAENFKMPPRAQTCHPISVAMVVTGVFQKI
jgi:hypothetical protein